MSRLSNNPSAHSANTMSNYYGTSFREKMKQMSKQEQIIEEKKRKIQQKLEEEMKNSASKSTTESHSEAAVVTSSPQSDIFRAKIFGKRHLNLRKTTDTKKLKCEDPSLTPPPVAPSISASQDMFANDGSFLERFKKLQGLLPTKQSNISLLTPTDYVKQELSSEETGTTEPKSTAIDALHTVPYLSTLSSLDTNPSSSSAKPPSFQTSPVFQSANVPPPPSVLPCLVVTTTITTAASVPSPSSLYADAPAAAATCNNSSSSSNSNTNSIPIIRSTPAVIPNYDNDMTTPVAISPTHPLTIKDDDKYDPTSPTEDISPVKVQPDPNSSPRENSSELSENQNSVSQNNQENISDLLLQMRHSVKRPNSEDSSSPKGNCDERVARIG